MTKKAVCPSHSPVLTAADCVKCPEPAEDEAVRDVPRWIMVDHDR